MADKTYEIEVKTTSDTDGITSVKDALQETKEEASATEEALKSAFEDATSEVEQLSEELALIEMGELEGDFDEVATALEEATDRANSLEEELNNVNSSGVDGAKESVDELDSSLQTANDSAEGLGANLSLLDSAVMMDMANEFSSMGGSAEAMAQQVEGASITVGQLSKNVGMAEPQMVSMINHISNATFPQNEAMAYANALNQMGVSASKLGDSATDMDKINDATGIGYEKVIKLTQGLQSMGISAENIPSSFNAIAFAQSNVTGGADTLQRTLMRQASTIQEYGMNVDQVVLIMSKLSERGVSTTKMGTELSKVLKENNGDLSAIEKELGLTSGELSNASSVTGEYEGVLQSLADEEAEHKTILEQLGAVWEDIALSMSPVIQVGGSVMGVLGQIGSVALNINSMVTLYNTLREWDKLQGVFSGVSGKLSGLKSGFTTFTSTVSSAVSNVGSRISSLRGTFTNLGSTVRGTVSSVGGRISSLKGTFSSFATTVRGAVTSVLSFSRTLLSNVVSASRTAITSLMGLARTVLMTGLNAMRSAGMWLVQKAQVLATAVANGIATASQWALNIAMSMNPIGLLVIAIVGLIAVLGYLYFNNEQVRSAIDWLGQSFMNIGQIIYGYLQQAFNTIVSTLQGVWNYIMTLGGLIPASANNTGNQVINAVVRFLTFIATLPVQLAMIFTNVIAKALGFGNNFSQRLIQCAISTVTGFINKIRELPGMIQSEFARIESIVSNFVTSLPSRVWDLGASIVSALKSALGIGSPGHMFYMFEGELERLKNAPLDMRYGITTSVRRLGESIVDVFNPKLNISDVKLGNGSVASQSSNGGEVTQVNNFYFTDTVVDNEDRMEAICDYITKKISWDNTTAGRTV